MYYRIVDPTSDAKQSIASCIETKPSSASSLKNPNGSYVSKELEQALQNGCIIVADQRPNRVKIYFKDQSGIKKFCVKPDCNTRSSMNSTEENQLKDLLYCTLGKRFELELIPISERVNV